MAVNILPLSRLELGSWGRVKGLNAQGPARRRMLDLGLIHDTRVQTVLRSPAGDPMAYEIRGAVIALRSEEAEKILVEKTEG